MKIEYTVIFVINFLSNDFKKIHLKSGKHTNNNRKRPQSKQMISNN